MAKQVEILTTPDLIGNPTVPFNVDGQNAAVWNSGITATIEEAVKCPCRTKNATYLQSCKNCLGTGWVYINKTRDKVIISSINSDTKFKEWSAENLGTASISFNSRSYISFMDRIIIEDSDVRHSQVLFPKGYDDNLYSYTLYDILSIEEVFRFISPDEELELLQLDTDYTFERNKILFTNTPVADITALKAVTAYEDNNKALVNSDAIYNFDSASTATADDDLVVLPDNITEPAPGRWLLIEDFTVSVRYRHRLMYFTIDIPHVIRNSYRKDSQGRNELQIMPVNCVARIAHYVIDALNFDGTNILDNSYHIT